MNEIQDPLNVSVELAGVETTMPLLPAAIYQFQVIESAVAPNKDNTGRNWNLKLALINPATAVDGREIKPNFPVYHILALQAKADSKDPDAFRRSLGETVDALLGTTKENRPNLTGTIISEAVGKIVSAHIAIDEYQGRHSNKVKRLEAFVG